MTSTALTATWQLQVPLLCSTGRAGELLFTVKALLSEATLILPYLFAWAGGNLTSEIVTWASTAR